MATMTRKPIDPSLGLPYPAQGFWKMIYRFPLILWRMGLGPLLGQFMMVITTIGRKSGQPRRVVLEYHQVQGRKYILAGWAEQSDWYKNTLANPYVTIQTASGTESMLMRRVLDAEELDSLFDIVRQHPLVKAWMERTKTTLTREEFLAQKDLIFIFAFDPTTEATPPALEVDLSAAWLIPVAFLAVFGVLRRFFKR